MKPDHKFFTAKLLTAKVIALAGLSGPLGWIAALFLTKLFNWLANEGVMFINMAAISFETEKDRKNFESAMDMAFFELEKNKNNLTKEQLDAIDDKVIAAFDKFVVFSKLRDG